MLLIADLAGVTRTLDALDLLLRALGPRDRVVAGQQEVAGVTVTDLHDVAGDAEVLHGCSEDELHLQIPLISERSRRRAAEQPHARS